MRFRTIIIICILTAAFGSVTGAYIAIAKGVPSIEELKKYRPTEGAKVFADDETLIGEFKVEKGIFAPLNSMPSHLKNAVISVEDSRFWQHKGVDYIGIGRALFKDIIHMSLKEGGSTITQQLAKIMFLTPEKTIQRKLREAQLAIRLEKELSKNEILELYLNRIYFGHGAYGVEMASKLYFGKSVSQITLPESALLAGLIKAPNAYSPYNNLVKAKERQEAALTRMEEEGYIKPSERAAAEKYPLTLSSLRASTETYNYFLEYIRQQLEEKYGVDMVYKGGLRVYTTLDRNAQIYAQQALKEGLREVDKRKGWRGSIGHKNEIKTKGSDSDKISFSASAGDIATGVVLSVNQKEAVVKARGITGKLIAADALWASNVIDKKTGKLNTIRNFKLTDILQQGNIIWVRFKTISGKQVTFSLEQEPEVEGAVVAVEPETGFIKAIVGGFNFSKSEYNRAVHANRQPGSAFKPIIYASALEHGFTPASIIKDEPVSYPDGLGGKWEPENYDHKYSGPTRLREALAYSRNVVTVKLVDAVGIDKVISFARNTGIQANIPRELTVALGSISITPLELAFAYSTFANNGVKMTPIAIKYIIDSKGQVIESTEPEGVESISPQTSFLITSIMEDVIKYGTGMRANIGRPAAGKTGTSNDYKDAWFVGYTPHLVGCVWVGYDDMRRSLGSGEVGGRAAAPIWANFMKKILSDEPAANFPLPEGIVKLSIDPATGLLSNDTSAAIEFFKEGTQPLQHSGPSSLRIERIAPPHTDYD
ncbi:MAG: PBP1A family penicillin-binding protein [Thermodesulfovibrionales bacterium]|nr:PBP1A family penicillin-binding protein [Thermodesulfovibrionales bacterium]